MRLLHSVHKGAYSFFTKTPLNITIVFILQQLSAFQNMNSNLLSGTFSKLTVSFFFQKVILLYRYCKFFIWMFYYLVSKHNTLSLRVSLCSKSGVLGES